MGKIFGFLNKYLRYVVITLIVLTAAFFVLFTFITPRPGEQNPLLLFPQFAEARFYDFRSVGYLENNPMEKSEHAVLAKIDDQSISQLGRFPWTRKVWIDLVEKLKVYGAKVVSFDVIFPEEEEVCTGDPDSLFSEVIQNYTGGPDNIIVGYSRTKNPKMASEEFPDILYNYLIETTQSSNDLFFLPDFVDKHSFPIEKLQNSDLGLGYINLSNDIDGVFRTYTVYANIVTLDDVDFENQKTEVQMFPSFGLLSYERYSGDRIKIHLSQTGDGVLSTKNGDIEMDPYGGMKLRYRGGRDAFHDISIIDIIKSAPDDPKMIKKIKNKIVFIGSTAFAAHDFRNSPMDPMLPGVYFHMNLADMLSEGRYFKKKESSAFFTWLILLLGVAIIIAVQLLDNAVYDILIVLSTCIAVWYADYFYFMPNGYELKLFFTLNCFILLYFWDTAYSFYISNKEKKQIKGTFSRYVAPTIVDEMLDNPEKLKMGGERKDITVFFSDVRDFTSISEKLSPAELSNCLNQYMNRMTNIVFETKGTLDKYIGDAIVAYWGAPIEIPDHPYLGVGAAVEMIELLPEINKDFERQGLPEFKVGIGLNTGICNVGNMGSDMIFSYTALGDHMNLGARLEGLCKPYGAQIIISEFTYDRLSDEQKSEFTFRNLDFVQVKGKEKPVKIYEVLHSFHNFKNDPYALEVYHNAYSAYLKKEFNKTIELLNPIKEKYSEDIPTQRIIKAAQAFIENPPPEDWNGVTIFNTK